MNPMPKRYLPLLLAALISGVLTWLGLSRPEQEKGKTGMRLDAVQVTPAAEGEGGPMQRGLSGGSMTDFLASLRTATPGALRQTWLSQYDLARRNAVIARWAAVDPRGCWEFLMSQSQGPVTDYPLVMNAFPLLFDIWMRSDHAAARDAFIEQTKEGIDGGWARSTLARSASMAGGDAWTALLGDRRFAALTFSNWGNGSPVLLAEASDDLNQMKSYTEAEKQGRMDLVQACGANAGAATVPAESALAAWQSLSKAGRKDYAESLGRNLAEDDLEKGAATVERLPRREQGDVARGLVSTWARKDAAASWDWLNMSLSTGRDRAAAAWAGNAPIDEAREILFAADPSPSTEAAATSLAGRMFAESPDRAGTWIKSLPDEPTRRAAWRNIALRWAQTSPDQAIEALTAADAPPLTNSLYEQVTSSLARESQEKARAFVERLPPDRAWFAAKGLKAAK